MRKYIMGAQTENERQESALSRDELVRYSRHILLPQVGEEGQRALKRARVLLVGAGGLGSPAALYLAAAGVGTIGLVDFDTVDLSNLQRQILHGSAGIGGSKLESARARLSDINPEVNLEPYATRLSSGNALEIARGYDLIIDGTDNFPTRYLINDTSVLLGIPNVHGSVFRFEGQASVFGAADGPCYRCLFREPPPPHLVPSCAEGGVLGVVPGLVGTIQATEAVKLILGIGDTLVGRLLLIDAMTMTFRTIAVRKDPECPACGTREITELIDYEEFCSGETAASSAALGVSEIEPAQLAERIASGEKLEIIDVREPYEWQIGHIPGARLVPLGTIADEIPRLDKKRTIILYCKMGSRSMNAAQQLAQAGASDVRNLAGGIARWIDEVDPDMPRY
ncbi:MAG TPA: molybdopterin-synthase adenylyltransferase MoeB [Gemmatimonadaceae bacterium]|nr:molybdopterin-synthase adenylyltransferase MoeB [Gemmatimonadaceae bacterium]